MAELLEFETTLYREDANNTLADKVYSKFSQKRTIYQI
jgi:hypothetical protein